MTAASASLAPLSDNTRIPPPSLLERTLWLIPILGWLAGWQLHKRRHIPRYLRLKEQLNARPKPDSQGWGNERRQMIAAILCKEIQKEFLWPTDHFIPTDTMAELAYPHEIDFQREFFVVMAIVQSKLRVDTRDVYKVVQRTDTLERLVSFLDSAPALPLAT